MKKYAIILKKTMINNDVTFDDLINYYMDSFDELLIDYLSHVEVEKDAKGKSIYGDSRALMYYNVAKLKRNNKEHLFIAIEDYSRIMFCLYS